MYRLELRKHVFATKEKLSFEETAKRFFKAIRSLFRWQKKLVPETKRNKPTIKINTQKTDILYCSNYNCSKLLLSNSSLDKSIIIFICIGVTQFK